MVVNKNLLHIKHLYNIYDEDYDGIKYKYNNNIINDYKNYYDNKLCEKKDILR